MGRKTYEELNELKEKYGVETLYSWSRYHKYKISQYEYFLSYVQKPKPTPDREDSAYAPYGSISHDILERLYTNQIEYKDMIEEFKDGQVTLEIADLKFERSNEEKNDKIKNKYIYDLEHFFRNHNKIETKIDIERFIVIMVGNYVFQGYADAIRKDEYGNVIIQDWKSSSVYTGEKAISEAGQLMLYAEGIRQLGVPIEKIKVCWNFLKYCNITITQANGKTSDRLIERIEIGNKLNSNAKMWLKKLGYEDELDIYLDLLEQVNDISVLPEEVQEKYKVSDCYVFVEVTEEIINKLKEDIINTLNEINNKEKQYETNRDESIFFDNDEDVIKQSYYFANLCSYSANLHKPYKKYLDAIKEKENNKNNIYSGVGNDSNNDDDDMSWLNDL
jgi:hypothetical protein